MPRVKRGTTKQRRRKRTIKHAKGYRWRRKTHFRAAKEALLNAWSRAFNDRRKKKNDFRKLWNAKINAATRAEGIPYSRFIWGLKAADIEIDRKILALLAENEPEVFGRLIEIAREQIEKNEKVTMPQS